VHTCARLTGGAVRCWGENFSGQLGLGNTNPIGDDENPTINVNLGAAAPAIAVTAGSDHACAVLTTGAARCWGFNEDGQLGLGDRASVGDNELPTVNVSQVLIGTDTTIPGLSITAPTPGQSSAGPSLTMTGLANDDGGITHVAVAIYRDVAGGQYWNGSGWQAANTIIPTTLTTPNATSTGWSYTFTPPPGSGGSAPGGKYAFAALAYDPSGNYAVAGWQTFSFADSIAPSVTIATPTSNQAFSTKPITISGTASDNAGVRDVLIIIYRPIGPVRFWAGSAWQSTYTTVPATLNSPGDTETTWTYSFNPPQTGGYYYAAAVVLDTSYQYTASPFTTFRLTDDTTPTATLSTPTNNATTSGTIEITGTSTDFNAVASVEVAIYNASTAQYWNGTTWQPTFATVPANVPLPGSVFANFNLSYTPPTPGYYLIAALAYDANYNYFLTPFNTVNHT
jgi:Regulator of chromosome condensation (RCC1) repeat/Bacterial Ig domain